MALKKVRSEISGIVFSLPWLIARDHGLFEQEGIDIEFVRALGNLGEQRTEDPNDINPMRGHTPFEEKQVSIYRA